MAYGIEFLRQRLSLCLTEPIQQALASQCLPDGQGLFVDRIDVGHQVAFSTPPGAPGAVEAALSIHIHLVSLAELMAHPNQSPPELGTSATSIVLRVRLQADGTVLSATAMPPDLSGTGIPSPIREDIAQIIANAANGALGQAGFDLAPMAASFGLPAPTAARVALTADSMVVEFDPAGPAGHRLGDGQQWGLFMDVQPVLDFALGKLPPVLREGLISTSAAWAPAGTTPRVTAEVRLDIGLFVFKLPLDVRLSVVPGAAGAAAKLRADLTWDVEVDAITVMGIPLSWLLKLAGFPGVAAALASEGFAEALELGLDGAAELADGRIVDAFAQIGAQRTGPRSFMREQDLPPLTLFGIELRPVSLLASGAGMTLGGTVAVKAVSRDPMTLSTQRFGSPFFPSNCRSSGGVKPRVRAEQVRYFAGTHFYDMGRFCGARFLPPDDMAERLIEPRLQSATAATEAFGFDLDIQEANLLQANVRLLVRSSRGTRLVDFGKPIPAVVDADGNVTNVIGHIWNCLTYSTEDKHSLIFGNDPFYLTKDDVVPPKEEPGWTWLLEEAWGIEVQMISVTGLEPGETVVYQSATHRVQVAADRDGRVLLPGFAPAGRNIAPATLTRLNQGPLTDREVQLVNSTGLVGGGLLRPRAEGEDFIDEGGLQRRPQWTEALRSMHIGAASLAALKVSDAGDLVALNPQPLPPEPPPELGALNPQPLPPEPPPEEHPLVQAIGLKAVQAVFAVPGAKPDQLAIALMQDGRKVVLDGTADRPRVAGTLDGPLGRTIVRNGFAVSQAGAQLRLFEIGR